MPYFEANLCRLAKNTPRIEKLLKKYNITKYNINADCSVDVYQDVDLSRLGLKDIPIDFNKIYGNFDIHGNQLTSLKGSPIFVAGHFDCFTNRLTSLEHSPIIIRGCFDFRNNNIKSLEYLPRHISVKDVHTDIKHEDIVNFYKIDRPEDLF